MKRNIVKLAFISILVISQMTSFCMAKEMIKAGDTCYLIDDNSDICKNELYYDGIYMRYFGADGKMVVGWYTDIDKGNTYYFNKTEGETYGTMVAGVCMVDGCKRIFCTDGSQDNGSLVKNKSNYRAADGGVYDIDQSGYVYDLEGNFQGDISKKVTTTTIDTKEKKVKENKKTKIDELKNKDNQNQSPIKRKLLEQGIIVSNKIK